MNPPQENCLPVHIVEITKWLLLFSGLNLPEPLLCRSLQYPQGCLAGTLCSSLTLPVCFQTGLLYHPDPCHPLSVCADAWRSKKGEEHPLCSSHLQRQTCGPLGDAYQQELLFHEGALDLRDKFQALLALVNSKLDDSIS